MCRDVTTRLDNGSSIVAYNSALLTSYAVVVSASHLAEQMM